MILQWLTEEFATHLGQSLEMMSGEKLTITAERVPDQAPAAGDLVWLQPFSIEGGRAWLSGPEAAWTGMGGFLLRAAGIEEHDAATAKSTFVETLNQAFAGLAREIGTRIAKEVTAGVASEIPEAPGGVAWNRLDIRGSDSNTTSFLLAFTGEIEKQLEGPAAGNNLTDSKDLAVSRRAPLGVENSRTLELLLDVELPVSVSFGRAQLAVKDVIKLTTGSIVELNRTVGEPVEVIVNNCVIARGEVVVIEGNFGVRIQEVISKQERLRTLY